MRHKTRAELEKRILELEAEVARLRAQPPVHVHHHYHNAPNPLVPVIVPVPQPYYPQLPTVICGGAGDPLYAGGHGGAFGGDTSIGIVGFRH